MLPHEVQASPVFSELLLVFPVLLLDEECDKVLIWHFLRIQVHVHLVKQEGTVVCCVLCGAPLLVVQQLHEGDDSIVEERDLILGE